MSRNTTRRTWSARPRRLELERLEERLVLSGVVFPSGDYAVDGVISPYGFSPDTTTLSYSFETAAGLNPFSAAFKENFREIFGWFNHTQVIDVSFAETTGRGDIAITPVNYGYGQAGTGSIWMNISYDRAGDTNGFQHGPGSHGYQALIHELGHAIGLKHTFDTPKLLPADDNQTNSAMTYNFSIEPGSFMRYDVAGLQYLFGAGIHNAGNDTYQFPCASIGWPITGESCPATGIMARPANCSGIRAGTTRSISPSWPPMPAVTISICALVAC